MKAERRHALKENALAKNLEQAPVFFQQYGSRILLVVSLGLLAFVFWRNHAASKAQQLAQTSQDMGGALYSLDLLRNLPARSQADQILRSRRDLARDIEDSLTRVLNDSEDSKLRAQALVARGDLNWTLANFPTIPTTQPDLAPTRSSDDLLKASEDAYKQVLAPPESDNHQAVVSARFGLAAIAENRQQWDGAKQFYQQIIDDASTAKEFKDFAQNRIEMLTTSLQKPVLIGSVAVSRPEAPLIPPGLPGNMPSNSVPTKAPSTQPSSLDMPLIGLPPSLVPPNPFGGATTRPSSP